MSRSVKLIGVGASPGAAVGHAFLIDRRAVQEPRRHVKEEEVEPEVARVHAAVRSADQELEDIRGKLVSQPQEHVLIIDAHRLMLGDPGLIRGVEGLIRSEQINAEWAVDRVIKQIASAMAAIEDPYLRERRSDVQYVGDRIIRALLGEKQEQLGEPPPGAIIVAHELSPADAMLLMSGRAPGGIVVAEGSRTSHTAIVARAMEIPAVLGVENLTEVIGKDDLIAIDGAAGIVVVHPSEVDQRAFLEVRRRYLEEEEVAIATREFVAETTDGHRITLRANIEFIEEIPSLISHGADGVGLYRTEFLYLNRRDLPSEEEHYGTYKRLLDALPGRQVTVRTFDLGGDKVMTGKARVEANPSLGLRAIRYCLAHPESFLPQLRALWRASVHGNLRVMFPLISGVGEFRRARRFFDEARDQVISEGYDVAENLPLGIMMETPSAAMLADVLAEEVDFFAIGTNDLIQYTLAIDRRNPDVSYLYQPMHPAILRLLTLILEAGKSRGVSVSICGEAAGDPAYTLVLVALGFEELSMSGLAIPMVKRIIRSSSRAEAVEMLKEALSFSTGSEVETYIRNEMARRFPDLCGRLPELRPPDESGTDLHFTPS